MRTPRSTHAAAPRNLAIPGPRLAPLDVDECLDRLARRDLGRLAFVVDAKPRIIPMNYLLHEGSILLRTGITPTLDAVIGSPVAFEVDVVDPLDHSGWSVVVHGRAEEVWEPDELARLRALPLQPWAPGAREHYLRIMSTAITGRRIA